MEKTFKSWAFGCAAGAFALVSSVAGGEETLAVQAERLPAPDSQTFQWASIWTQKPVEGAPEGSIYHADRLQGLKTRLETYGGEDGEAVARERCLPLPETLDILQDPANALTFLKLSGTQRLLMSLLFYIESTSLGKQFVEAAAYHDVLVCASHDDPDRSGFYDANQFLVAVQTKNRCGGYDHTPLPGDGLKETEAAYGFLTYALAEEISHAAQHVLLENFVPKNLENSWAADYKLWNLAVEAQAKLFAAWILLEMDGQENGMNGFPLFWAQQDGTVEGGIAALVKGIVDAHGKEALQARPELLLPAFLRFFESESSMQDYMFQNLEGVNSLKSLKRIPEQDFVDAFGHVPDSEGSLFGHRAERVPGGRIREALFTVMAPGTTRDWLEAQMGARKRGRAGPKLKIPEIPESGHPSCVPGMAHR